MLIDFFPIGPKKELVDALEWMKGHSQTHIFLGFRDIIDIPTQSKEFIYRYKDYINAFIDHIFIYGDPQFFDFINEYDVSTDLGKRCHM